MLQLEALENRVLLATIGITGPAAFGPWVGSPVDLSAGAGRVDADSLDVTNNSGGPVTIDRVELSGDWLSLHEPLPGESLPGGWTQDTIESIEPGRYQVPMAEQVAGTGLWRAEHFYRFEATAGEMISLGARATGPLPVWVGLYNVEGEELEYFEETYATGYAQIDFPAGYTGAFYAVAGGGGLSQTSTFDMHLELSDAEPELVLPEVGETTSYAGVVQRRDLGDPEVQWLTFEAPEEAWGREISITVRAERPNGENTNVDVSLFDKYGTAPALALRDVSLAEDPLMPGTDVAVLTHTVWTPGVYYIQVNFDEMTQGPYVDVLFDVEIEATGSALVLNDLESVSIPVYGAVAAQGDYNGVGRVVLDNEAFSTFVQFQATGAAPDVIPWAVTTSDLLVEEQVQAGAPATFEVILANSVGDLTETMEIGLYFSPDTNLDTDGDNLLDADAVEIGRLILPAGLHAGDFHVLTGDLMVPAMAAGEYYLFAVADPDNTVVESGELPFPGDNTIGSVLYKVTPGVVVVTDSVHPVADDPATPEDDVEVGQYDRAMDFGVRGLGTKTAQYVTLTNRSAAAVTLAGYELAAGGAFVLEDGSSARQVGEVILPGESIEVVVRFAPVVVPASGERTVADTLTLTLSNGESYDVALAGEMQGGSLAVEESSGIANDDALAFGQVRLGADGTTTITLKNLGDQELAINGVSFAAGGLSRFSTDYPGGQVVLAAGESVGYTVSFEPTATGPVSDTLRILTNSAVASYPVAVSGTGIRPVLVATDSLGDADDHYLPFPWQPVGAVQTETVTLANTGTASLRLTGWSLADGVASGFSATPANDPSSSADDVVLEPGESYDVTIRYAPGAAGTLPDTLTVYAADAGEVAIDLQGLAQDAGYGYQTLTSQEVFDDLTVGMGDVLVGSVEGRGFRVVNTENVALTVDEVTIAAAGFSVTTPGKTLPVELAPGQSLLVQVQFDAGAAGALGEHVGSVVVVSNGAAAGEATVTATAVKAELGLGEDTIAFGEVDESGQAAVQPLVVTNDGSGVLIIRGWSFTDDQFTLTAPAANWVNGQIVVAPGTSAVLGVAMDPQRTGAAEATLTLLTNDPDAGDAVATVAVSATNLGQPFVIESGTAFAFRDASGDPVRVLVRNGQATMYLTNGEASGGDIARLTIENSNTSTVVLVAAGGEGTSVAELISEGSVGRLMASKVRLDGMADFGGVVEDLRLGDVAAGSTLTMAMGMGDSARVTAGAIGDDVEMDFEFTLERLLADSFAGGSVTAKAIEEVTIRRGGLGADVVSEAGAIGRVRVRDDISGAVNSAWHVGEVTSLRGSVTGAVRAAAGSVGSVQAAGAIGGSAGQWSVYAQDEIGRIFSRNGVLTGLVRGSEIGQVRAGELDGAVLSSGSDIDLVQVRGDVRASELLAGYDIGANGLTDVSDDSLGRGSVGLVRFGGEWDGSSASAGVINDDLYAALGLVGPVVTPSPAVSGTLKVLGRGVRERAGADAFGLYATGDITTNLQEAGSFVIMENL